MKRLALIPARGGSKGIPNKNIQIVGEKSLLARSIESAITANIFSEICVSTDSPVIAREALKCGVPVPFLRPDSLSTDESKSLDLIVHALDFYEKVEEIFDTISLLQPTSPFRTGGHVAEANSFFESSEAETLISVMNVSNFHESTLYTTSESVSNNGFKLESLSNLNEKSSGTRRQEFQNRYWRNGAIYIVRPKNIRKTQVLLTNPIVGFEMDWLSSINIDEPEDLALAQLLANKLAV